MSRYKGNGEKCPGCGVTYGAFRTGLTYRDVKLMLWDNSKDPKEWKYKRRGTVLGLWHQMKKELWERHTEHECAGIERPRSRRRRASMSATA